MTLTLLLDLDDTLLNTNIGEFIPAYFAALTESLQQWVAPEAMLPALAAGTQKMLANDEPLLTLQQVFEASFYPKLGIDKERAQQPIEDFYDNVFPSLRGITSQRRGARELVDWALGEGHRVAIATDPIFPRKANYERLRWAGLDPERFDIVSAYETFHFTKTHSAYYAELLGKLGWPDGPVLMVGNDLERDLACAQELGLAAYQVDGKPLASFSPVAAGRAARTIGYGSLTDLRNWLQSVDPGSLEPSFTSEAAILGILESTPAVLHSMTSGLSPDEWTHEPTPDDWALIEILCHLRDTEREVYHPQIEILRQEAHPFVPRPDAAVWAKQRNYLDEDGTTAVASFAAARQQTLRELQTFSPDLWRRAARHAIFGPTNSQEVVGFMANHDRLHIQQAWQTRQGSV